MDKNVDLIMINQQEEEQLRSQGVPNIRIMLLAFPFFFIPNIILILGIKGKASVFPRCTCSVAGSGFDISLSIEGQGEGTGERSKKYLRTARDAQCNSISDNLNSPITETISLGFFSHFFSAHSPLDNSNFSLTRTKFRFP